MYEYITGTVTEIAPAYAGIEAAGVGYFINISLQTYSEIENAQSAKLYVHYIVREDAHILYGFATKAERELFRLLIGVSGVGGNTARMIQSTYSTTELRNIIGSGNAVLLKNVKGLGLKTAQKIIVELSGKMIDLKADDKATSVVDNVDNESFNEALSALVMLGFQKTASEKVLKKLFKDNADLRVEEAIRLALKQL